MGDVVMSKVSKHQGSGFLLPVITIVLMSVSSPVRSADSIRIGCIAALSGAAADIGNRLREGAELAVAQMPEINGRKIELIVRDSKGDPATAQQQVESLISDRGIVAATCVSLSSEGAALAAAAKSGRLSLPIIQSSAVADEITGTHCSPWTFRTVPTATTIARAVAKFSESHPDLAAYGWYTLASDYLYGRSSAKALAATPGIKVVGESFAPLDTSDWTPYINKVFASNAKALWLPVALGAPYVQLMTQANNVGLLQKVLVLAPTGLPQEFIDQLGQNGLGVIEPASAVLMTGSTIKPMIDAYYAKHKKAPSEGALQSFIGTSILLKAIETASPIDAEGVKTALQNGTFETPLGAVSFRKGDQQLLAPVWTAKIEKLNAPIAGAQYGFVATQKYAANDLLPPLDQTMCKAR
jgi:branched-chain amino acid transport system substrate-binding protein